ncbi:MAG TPA: hypothetical protein VM689_11095 [Aliidongia sp.]|nr:hypothetical protein [Aliidongia sp.]
MELNRKSAPEAHTQPADPAGARTETCAREDRTGKDVRLLEELIDIGMDLARSVREQALDPDGKLGAGEAATAFAHITKSVRLTIALKNKLIEDRDRATRKRAEAAESEAQQRRRTLAWNRSNERVRRVKHAVRQAIERDVDESDVENLLADLNERLEDEDILADLRERSVSEVVARICRGLGIKPDWRLWEGEDWAIAEAEAGVPGSPYAGRRPAANSDRPPAGAEEPAPPRIATGSDPP